MIHPSLKKFLSGNTDFLPEHEELINASFRPYTTKRNEVLVAKGAIATNLYFVVKGCLRIFITDEFEKESTRYLIFEGSMGTSFPSFILKQPSNAILQSIGMAELLVLSYDNRERLLKEIPGWETETRKGMELEYIASIQRIESFVSMDAKARYAELMKTRPEFILNLPARIVADYLGISKETLSRLKSK
jgi:CRP/FNR family transcriptional regulator, cyclic AMP receptor protein